jgi:NAD(P)H-hydrate epimerase
MTIRPLSREEVRSIDARAASELGLSTLVLMENAGRGAAEILREWTGPESRVLILCGPGNNGGDGGVVARHLDSWGYPVRVVWFADPSRLSADAVSQHTIVRRSGIDQQDRPGTIDRSSIEDLLRASGWVVDGLLGTGLTRPVEGPLREVIEAVNASGKPVLALDLPSGLDCDTGQPQGVAIRASVTATFVAPKLGFGQPGAAAYTGGVRVVEIGVPRRMLEAFAAVPPRGAY